VRVGVRRGRGGGGGGGGGGGTGVGCDAVPLPWTVVVPSFPFVVDAEVCVAGRHEHAALDESQGWGVRCEV
jgi:hypothetical protein